MGLCTDTGVELSENLTSLTRNLASLTMGLTLNTILNAIGSWT